MDSKQTRTGSAPRLTVGCVLGVLLAASPACMGEDLQLVPRDELDQNCAGGSTEGWVSCCEAAPPSAGPADACTGGVIGDGNTCMDLSVIELAASGACEALGASLVALAGAADESCPNGALEARYECCKSGAPPEAPWLK